MVKNSIEATKSIDTTITGTGDFILVRNVDCGSQEGLNSVPFDLSLDLFLNYSVLVLKTGG